jgi:hypothetical protein
MPRVRQLHHHGTRLRLSKSCTSKFATQMPKAKQNRKEKSHETIDEATEERLEQACQEWFTKTAKTSRAALARKFTVPYMTFLRRLEGILPKKKAHDTQTLLNATKKKTLVEWIQYLSLTGHPVNKQMLRLKVKAIMRANGKEVNEGSVSASWICGFMLEFKEELKGARGSGLDPKCAQAFNFNTVNKHFEMLRTVLEENNIPWRNVYNMDEKGIQVGGGRKNSREKFFFAQSDKMMYQKRSDNLQLVTVIDCICADGTAEIRPAFVFSGMTKFPEWLEVDEKILCV